MRKLKLQMQITVDGFVAGPNGELDWMTGWDSDDELKKYESEIADAVDTLLMGRKMTDEFFNTWTKAAENPDSPDNAFGKRMVDIPKVVFTKTLDESPWANTVLAKGDLVEEVKSRKNQSGKDILVYGGANFVRSLIKENLIDEYNFFVNPTAIGNGMTIFKDLENKLSLQLVKAKDFDCGVVLHCYEAKQ